jgi:hypothetical protein
MANQTVNVREAFRARDGYYLMDFDYSQIENRLSAALAGEGTIIKGYLKGYDYYIMLYAAMYGITIDQVTDQNRKLGKILALGQNYGQEEYGLAKQLQRSVDVARELMDRYWAGLPATKQAKEDLLQRAIQTGGVRTWFGRWRALPELFLKGIDKKEQQIKKKAIRSVWNTHIQGTAADWLKIAMVRCDRGLEGRDAHMLLTVHDELVLEVAFHENFNEIRQITKEAMEFKVKGLPVGHQDLYPDGFFVPIGEEYGLDWGNTMPLDDKVSKGKQIQGFRTYCAQHNIPVNFDSPRQDVVYSFLPPPKPQEVPVVIAPRIKNIVDEKKEVLMSAISGKHPIDHIVDLLNQMKAGGVIEKPVPVKKQLDIPMSADAIIAEAQAAVARADKEIAVTVEPIPAQTQATDLIPVTFEAARPETKANGVHKPAEMTTNFPLTPVVPPTPPAQPQSSNDFTYPCVIVNAERDITAENLKFLVALFTKFRGDYSVFIVYRDKTIRAGAKYLVDPKPTFVTYVKKCLGDSATCDIYDAAGKAARGKVSFV